MEVIQSERKRKPYRKRLLFNIPEEIDREIERCARHKGITKTKFILQAVAEQIIKDKLHEMD